MKVKIEKHHGINIVRDDLLIGGTKSILMPSIIKGGNEFVYASTVYGGFQIALAAYCQKIGKRATIFCAKRNELFRNTVIAKDYGAKIVEIPDGMLTVVEKRARDYAAKKSDRVKLEFGGSTDENKLLLAARVTQAIKQLGHEPKEIWCAIGSGTLFESILLATKKATVHGVIVGGRNYTFDHSRGVIHHYLKPFGTPSKFKASFPSMPNYDLKAFEHCVQLSKGSDVLFWNVL
jgi:hypothetical protein